MPFYDAIRVGASGAGDFEVERSLRFNDNDGAYLSRTPSSAGNRKTWTWSAWIKRANIGSRQILFSADNNATHATYFMLELQADDNLRALAGQETASATLVKETSMVLRDTGAWYHIVFKFDATNATAVFYVNGQEITDYSSTTNPSNQNFQINATTQHFLGRFGSSLGTSYFDGYMAEVNFIDGQAYDSSYFGETNADTGQWVPKKYAGSYGTNGFRLNFSDNSGTTATTLGKDLSGNGNNFTPNNFSVSAGVGNDSLEDTPTNNFCTLNSISLGQGNEQNTTFSNGNLDFTDSSSSNRAAISTFGLKTGKWYYELTCTNNGVYSIGWYDMPNNGGSFYRNNGGYSSSFGGGGQFGYSSWTTNDVIGVAIDFDSGKIWYAKNNTWQSGDPATGNSPTNTFTTGRTLFVEVFTDNVSGTKSGSLNFGQRAFIYTPPTGYKKLNSANLPDPTILLPNKHFETLVYSGNGGTKSITGLNFQPDWVWVKNRTGTNSNVLFDAVRGATKELISNLNNSESTEATSITSFDSNGFSVGSNGGVNDGSGSYVAWNWDAGETDSATYTVKVVSDSGNKYRFNDFGTSAVTLDLAEGGTYTFDGSDSSMSGHPFVIGTAANGSVYSTGVTYQLDGASVTYSAYTSGYSSATTRKLIITVPASAPQLYYWCSIHSGMGGAINTNTTLGSSNFAGSIQSTVKANTTSGFSIVGYTGNGISGATVGHGLGVAPKFIITKQRSTSGHHWRTYHASIGATKSLYLDLNNAESGSDAGFMNNTEPTSSVFSIGNDTNINESSQTHIAYCFSEVAGYSKFGKYTGNGNANGPFVFLGFKPAWIMIKRKNLARNWIIFDNKRDTFNVVTEFLEADTSIAEATMNGGLDFLSNGFKLKTSDSDINANDTTPDDYVYFAFAESPFKNSRAR